MCLASCVKPQPGPVTFPVTKERVLRASCDSPYHCAREIEDRDSCDRAVTLAEKASTSVIAINERGSYSPVFFTFSDKCKREPIRQPMPGVNCKDNEGPIAEKFTDCFVEHAKDIMKKVKSPPKGKTYHLLVFIHGGLNTEQPRLERASSTPTEFSAMPASLARLWAG